MKPCLKLPFRGRDSLNCCRNMRLSVHKEKDGNIIVFVMERAFCANFLKTIIFPHKAAQDIIIAFKIFKVEDSNAEIERII